MKGEAVFLALGELGEDLVHEAARTPARHRSPIRRLPLIAAAVILLAALVTAVAAWEPVKTALGIQMLTATGDKLRAGGGSSSVLQSGGREICVLRDGRILFLCWEEEIDVTDRCSERDYYAWEYAYDNGVRQLVLVGGTPESAGWLQVYFFTDGTAAFDLPCAYDYYGAQWFLRAIEDRGLDFLRPQEIDYGDLAVPTTKELLEQGYPVNALGETYGPTVNWLPEPDLLLARGKDGESGYLRRTELDEATGHNVSSPEEALAWNEYVRQRGPVDLPLYREDGVTVVGYFTVGNKKD